MLKKIEGISTRGKSILEKDFGLVYVTKMEVLENGKNPHPIFLIPKENPSIFSKIDSRSELENVKKEIGISYENFINRFYDFFDRVEKQLDEKTLESFEIIGNILGNRKKKLEKSLKKFEIENEWKVENMRVEFFYKVQKNLEDILSSTLTPIQNGIRENSSYEGIVTEMNTFLKELGVYTEKIEAGEKIEDYDIFEPESCEECKTGDVSKRDEIREVVSYPYLTNGDEDIPVLAGKVFVWQIQH
jgi:hypothetical protein